MEKRVGEVRKMKSKEYFAKKVFDKFNLIMQTIV